MSGTPKRILVLKDYPNAVCLNKKGVNYKTDYYEVWSDGSFLGKGKSKKAAWNAAYKNIK